MSIQFHTSTFAQGGGPRTDFRQSGGGGTSFQDLLTRSAAAERSGPAAAEETAALSETSRRVLERIRQEEAVSKEDWTGLLDDLLHSGRITPLERVYAGGGMLIPITTDANGHVLKSDVPAILQSTKGGIFQTDEGKWPCDPLAFLDEWIKALRKWAGSGAAVLSNARDSIADGADACERVLRLVEALTGVSAGSGTEAQAAEGLFETPSAGSTDSVQSALDAGDLKAALYEARLAMLRKMEFGKEKEEEEQAWDEMMEYVDAWIDSLQDEGDLERSARAYAAVKARDAGRPARKITAADLLLKQLSESLRAE